MHFTSLIGAAALLCSTLVAASPAGASPKSLKALNKRYSVERDGVRYEVFKHAATGAKLEFVKNSGVCETTPGVNQYSGYLSVGSNMNMWFWFFESRNSPTTAPLAMWLNGGPGCSSMIGLFQENGPCHFEGGSTEPSNNTLSFNNVANMLYVDQPIGTGFSYGSDPVDSTASAAPYVWKLLQAFYDAFPQYTNRDFGLFTESYGGHYGPEFASYFQAQNQKIESKATNGTKIPLVALGINNGWVDPALTYEAYITFSANNSYKQILTQDQAAQYQQTMDQQCTPALKQCTTLTGNDQACANAENICGQQIEGGIQSAADFDVYDVRAGSNDPNPPKTYSDYLARSDIQKKIGAQHAYTECGSAGDAFSNTGDSSRSLLPALSSVVSSGIQVLLWAGDADWICNYQGNFAAANALSWSGSSEFKGKALADYTVAGNKTGLYKTVNNLSWLQVYEAGHEVPYYQPATALQVFTQTITKKAITPS